jgi:DNA-binding MarR family transcriptional regulator
MGEDFSHERYEALAEFRYRIRRFQHFSEQMARDAGLEPQQHQLLLSIKGSTDERLSVGAIAERLQVQHHTAVELVARTANRGLVNRVRGEQDRRQVFVTLAPDGDAALRKLSAAHHQELQTAAPELTRILQRLIADESKGDDVM